MVLTDHSPRLTVANGLPASDGELSQTIATGANNA
jgi:hypothetical protein